MHSLYDLPDVKPLTAEQLAAIFERADKAPAIYRGPHERGGFNIVQQRRGWRHDASWLARNPERRHYARPAAMGEGRLGYPHSPSLWCLAHVHRGEPTAITRELVPGVTATRQFATFWQIVTSERDIGIVDRWMADLGEHQAAKAWERATTHPRAQWRWWVGVDDEGWPEALAMERDIFAPEMDINTLEIRGRA
jgi:hypothetical protein